MKEKLSERQKQILDFIKSSIIKKGFPPSVRDIGDAVGLSSTSSVFSQLEALEKKGYIRRDDQKSRSIEIIDDMFNLSRRELVQVPMIGTVTAGQPILAVENIMDYIPFPVEMMPNSQVFMLKVKGESMINAGILDGDQIIVKQQSTAKNGDQVVALIDDSATVKTYYKEDGHYRLQPENDTMEPLIFDEIQILGVVIGVLRMY